MVVATIRGPKETGWVGWHGGWAIRRHDQQPISKEMPAGKALEEANGAGISTSTGVDKE